MSKAKDRARAESGTIFRDGKYVNKEEWYAANLTPEMRARRQVGVDKAIAQAMADKLDPKDTDAVIAEAELKHPTIAYHCTKCGKWHIRGKIHQDHWQYQDILMKEA